MTSSEAATSFYPIGTPGKPWGPEERAHWRSRQRRQRSHRVDVVAAVDRLRGHFDVQTYGEVESGARNQRGVKVMRLNQKLVVMAILVIAGAAC